MSQCTLKYKEEGVKKMITVWGFALGLSISGLALSQAAQRPTLLLEGFLVITETKDGKTTERFEKAANAKPGSVLEYRTTAQNPSDKPISKLNVDLPIPKNTFYLEATASNSNVATLLASADNKRTFAKPPLVRKVQKNGKTVEEIIPANQYTHLRWAVAAPLAAKSSLVFKARVKIK
jgi:uncharacterized repeat protein (TIGR01451 family)